MANIKRPNRKSLSNILQFPGDVRHEYFSPSSWVTYLLREIGLKVLHRIVFGFKINVFIDGRAPT